MSFHIDKRNSGVRLLGFSLGPRWFRVTGYVALRRAGVVIRRFRMQRGYLYPSMKAR